MIRFTKEEIEMLRFALRICFELGKKNDCLTQADERRYADLIDKIDIVNHVNIS